MKYTDAELKVEVSGGYLLVAMKIPSVTCDACGAVYTPTVDPAHARGLVENEHPLSMAFQSPWCLGDDTLNWVWIYTAGEGRMLVCAPCGADVTRAKRAGDAAQEAAKEAVVAKAKARLERR